MEPDNRCGSDRTGIVTAYKNIWYRLIQALDNGYRLVYGFC